MTTFSTPTTPVALSLWRSRHRIASTRDYDPDTGRMVDICAVDGIRLYAQRGRWVHDPSAIKELAALERGEGVDWHIRANHPRSESCVCSCCRAGHEHSA